ncbi:MAG: hypothetical protein ABWK53_03005 [Anaerolineales bacterium]
MTRLTASLLLLPFLLSACGSTATPLPAPPTASGPTATPRLVTPTPVFLFPATATPSETPPLPSPTSAPTPTFTPTLTPTPAPALTAALIGCNTSVDLSHGMGEVTNAYATVANPGGIVLHQVCATLSASDEGRPHPDKTVCVEALANGYQVTLKLTVDTGFRVDTSIEVAVVSAEGLSAAASSPSCRDLSIFSLPPGDLGVPVAIQSGGPVP